MYQEDMEKGSENAGDSSSSYESNEYGVNQPDLNKSPSSMLQRSEEILRSHTTLSPLSAHSFQQPRISNIRANEWSDESIQSLNHEQNNVDDRKLIPTSSGSVVVEHIFMSQAMETLNHGSIAHSNGSLKNSVEASKDYHLPISNLPSEFRLGFSSRLQLPQTQQGNWRSESSLAKTNWTNWQPFSQITTHEPAIKLGSQEFGFQALLNQIMASDNFHVNDDRPIQQRVGSSTVGVSIPFQLDGIPSNPNKRKMTWQDDTPPTPNLPLIDWMSLGEGNQGRNNSLPTASCSRSKIIKNEVYDPSYAAVGLPVDPHLRMFLARRANAENKDNKNNREDCGSKTVPRKTS
ncbi:hypothetical protein CRYUN_Cryun08bG0065400 [Craigia yunnanensis]